MSAAAVRLELQPVRTSRDPLPSTSRYNLLLKIASGGMGSVYVACLNGADGFRRIVAVKRAHPHLLEDPIYKDMLLGEAKVSSLVRHPNVVAVQDVEEVDGELLLVMDYVEGASLAQVVRASHELGRRFDPMLAVRVLCDVAEGIHAMHGLCDEDGKSIGLVHRDVSPQNVLVGMDGVARIADLGIAKVSSPRWAGAAQTATGSLRGKTGYMSPEYIETGVATPKGDIFALGVVAWETLTHERLFKGATQLETMTLVREKVVPPPSSLAPDCPPELDAVVLRALARNPDDRWPTARAFGDALDAVAKEKGSTTPRPALEEHMEALFLPILTTRRTTVRSLVECPPARPMMLSEVEVVSRPSPTSERPTIDVDIEVPREPLLARRRLRRALAAGGAVVALFSLATILALGHGDALAPATPLGELDRPASFAPVRLTHADFVVRNAAVEPESEPTPASHTVATKEATPKMLPARLRPSLPAVPPNPYAP